VTKAAEPTDTETLVFKMTMKNVEFTKLNEASKEALTVKCRDMIAEQAGVSKSAVSVTLSQGSVIITAEIKAPKGSASFVQTDMQKAELSSKVLTVAKTIPGVQDAATGIIEVTPVEVESKTMNFQTSGDTTQTIAPAPAPAPAVQEDVTTTKPATKATPSPASSSDGQMTSSALYPSIIVACVVPMAVAMALCGPQCAHSSPTSGDFGRPRDPLVSMPSEAAGNGYVVELANLS
jgi:hypothetical protein